MASKFDLAYIHMMDGLGFGFHDKCKAMELKDVRPLISGDTVLIGNVGYTAEAAVEVPSKHGKVAFALSLVPKMLSGNQGR